jgi:hypothetical protein
MIQKTFSRSLSDSAENSGQKIAGKSRRRDPQQHYPQEGPISVGPIHKVLSANQHYCAAGITIHQLINAEHVLLWREQKFIKVVMA